MKGISSEAISAAIQQAEANQLAADVMPAVQDVTLPPTLHNRLPHGDDGIGRIGVISALAVGSLVAIPAGCGATSYHIDKYGTAYITSIKVGEGYYCNSEFTAHAMGIETTASQQTLIHVHKTISEEMTSGDFTSKVCLKFDSLDVEKIPKGQPNAGKMLVKLVTDGDPAKSDVLLTMYPADPTNIKYKPSHNWVSGFSDLGSATVNAIPGVNTDEGNSVKATLMGIDEVQAFNLISKTCGDLAIQKLTGSNLPGGNMQEHLFADLVKLAKSQSDVHLKTSDFIMQVDSHNNGLPSQYDQPSDATGKDGKTVHYDTKLKQIQKEHKNLQFPSYDQMVKDKKLPLCGDPINGGAPAPSK